MMKKLFAILILACIFLPNALAIISTGHIHTSDYYAVSFDGEGDAIVRAKLYISNIQSSSIDKINLEFPERIIFYRAFESYRGYNIIEDMYEAPLSDATFLTIDLPESIKPGEQAALIFLYKIPEYAEKSLGRYKFNFRTITDPQASLIEHVRVAINVQPGYYLKGAEAEIDYKKDYFGTAAAESLARKPTMDYNEQFYIEYTKGYVKEAYNLDTHEAFEVSGTYSNSWLFAHFPTVILTFIGLIILIYMTAILKNRFLTKKPRSWNGQILLAGALSSLTFSILWSITVFILNNIHRWINYRYEAILIPPLILALGSLLLASLFGPPIYIGSRHGFWLGTLTFAIEMAFLIVFAILFTLYFSTVGNPPPILYGALA